jgi:tetratricopeptide (TPR) repeat protein
MNNAFKRPLTVLAAVLLVVAVFSCRSNNSVPVDEQGLPDTIIAMNRLIEAKPGDASLYAQRARLFLEHRMADRAMADADKAISLDPKTPGHYIIKADVFFSRGKVHESILWLEKARSVSDKDVNSLLKLGEVFFFIKDYKKSLLYLDTASKLDDTNAQAWLLGGFAMAEAGDTLNAIRYFTETLKRDKNSYRANIMLAVIYTHKLNPIALEYYQNALNIKPESGEVYYNMGKFFQDVGKYNEAIDAYLAVTRLKDDMGFRDNAFYGLGYIHIELQVYDAARDYFGAAIQANPAYFQAYYAKGFAHERLGDLYNAKAYYDKALELNPNYELAREALHNVIGLMRSN